MANKNNNTIKPLAEMKPVPYRKLSKSYQRSLRNARIRRLALPKIQVLG